MNNIGLVDITGGSMSSASSPMNVDLVSYPTVPKANPIYVNQIGDQCLVY